MRNSLEHKAIDFWQWFSENTLAVALCAASLCLRIFQKVPSFFHSMPSKASKNANAPGFIWCPIANRVHGSSTPALLPSSFEKYHCPASTVVALPVANLHWRLVFVAHVENGYGARPPGSGGEECNRWMIMNLSSCIERDNTPFTYRGKNGVLWGCFAKNIFGPEIPLMW